MISVILDIVPLRGICILILLLLDRVYSPFWASELLISHVNLERATSGGAFRFFREFEYAAG